MLRFQNLTMKNFGPFRGTQSIDFPKEDGVVLVYGENGKGKTTLLNAIRYGLFGKVIGRGSRPISLHEVGNWEAANDLEFGFQVSIDMVYEGKKYKLVRTCKPRLDLPSKIMIILKNAFYGLMESC